MCGVYSFGLAVALRRKRARARIGGWIFSVIIVALFVVTPIVMQEPTIEEVVSFLLGVVNIIALILLSLPKAKTIFTK